MWKNHQLVIYGGEIERTGPKDGQRPITNDLIIMNMAKEFSTSNETVAIKESILKGSTSLETKPKAVAFG